MEAKELLSSPGTLFDRYVGHQRSPLATLGLVLLVYLPTLAAALDLGLADLMSHPSKWSSFTAPTVIAYILVITPIMARGDVQLIDSFRPIVQLEDHQLAQILRQARSVPTRLEVGAIIAGLILGAVYIGGPVSPGESWHIHIWRWTTIAMFGMLAWAALVSVFSTRILSVLLRQPLEVNPLDTRAFDAVGRSSLILALVFVGGTVLGILLSGFSFESLADARFWVTFLPMSFIPIGIFFLSTASTHRVMAAARNGELARVRRQLHSAGITLLHRLDEGSPPGDATAQVTALLAYEQRLRDASTWPYNTAILRTLVVSVLIPLGTVLIRPLLERIFG
ncbi:MAG TPA: hypothetical protein VLL77_08430 [Anaerolineales bacterium]|nr:hypothetical protein [Anaerolineales bacterium]